MATTLRDLLTQQKMSVEAQVERLSKESEERREAWMESVKLLDDAKSEWKRIDLVLDALERASLKSAKPTIMQAILEVLKQHPNGMTALEILADINSRYFDGKILRTSLSPQLSRLKERDHKIELRGNRWFLAPEKPSLLNRRV
jgi:hypothetical protein